MTNQCDGCLAGRPVDKNGNHSMGDGAYRDLMACQRALYSEPNIRFSHLGGLETIFVMVPWDRLSEQEQETLRRAVRGAKLGDKSLADVLGKPGGIWTKKQFVASLQAALKER